MVEFLNSWVQGIVVAVIIATIIEMIVPEGNNKKYVKIVIGIYMLFTIISPVMSKLGKQDMDLKKELNIEYGKSSSFHTNRLEESNEKSIQVIYEENLKTDMKNKLKEKGYEVLEVHIIASKEEKYALEEIRLQLQKRQENGKELKEERVTSVNKIQIGNEQVKKEGTSENTISKEEVEKIKQYLSSVYEIKETNIKIN